ncbi:MAG: hypothetical protein GX592_06450 [Clostridiales bacterium]|nr:hypothetical protein [Clostridiales bacterium]
MRWEMGIDLGTRSVRAALPTEGPVLSQAAALALREGRDVPVNAGDAAFSVYGRTCEGVSVHFPLHDGTLKNNVHAQKLLQWLYYMTEEKRKGKRLRALLTCAAHARAVQREALLQAALDAGALEAGLINSDAASALGAGLDIMNPQASLIVDVGAGKITSTLFTRGLVAASAYLPYGVGRIDERIQRMLRTEKGFLIGPKTAEDIKQAMATALTDRPAPVSMPVAGLNLQKRVPEILEVEPEMVARACEEVVGELVFMVASVVDNAPEELSADLNDAGCVLAGGGAAIAGLDKRLGDRLGIPTRVAESPDNCGVIGIAKVLEEPEKYEALVLERMAKQARH